MKPEDVPESREYDSVDELGSELLGQFSDQLDRLKDGVLDHVDLEITLEPERINLICEQSDGAPQIETQYGSTDPAALVHDAFVDAARCTGRRLETDLHMCNMNRFVGHVPLDPNLVEVST